MPVLPVLYARSDNASRVTPLFSPRESELAPLALLLWDSTCVSFGLGSREVCRAHGGHGVGFKKALTPAVFPLRLPTAQCNLPSLALSMCPPRCALTSAPANGSVGSLRQANKTVEEVVGRFSARRSAV
ncbi:hypothetical protein EYF80_000688 [Liparis tanakae]|uniref:Uncharacterized protein n=1 Tax=Liparis tanakae TaxID=230148 RepID=A0A4Z2JFL5_9TELE|nr:hypothetical protein EYF80_000688 [Liparis tanakae]